MIERRPATFFSDGLRLDGEVYPLEGSGHTDCMFDDHPTFRHVVKLTHEFIAGAVAAQ